MSLRPPRPFARGRAPRPLRLLAAALSLALASACAPDSPGVTDPLGPDGPAANRSPGAPTSRSVLQVRIATHDAPTVLLQYELRVGGTVLSVGGNDTITVPQLPAGEISVSLDRVPATCAVQGENPRRVALAANGLVRTEFFVACGGGGGEDGGLSVEPRGAAVTQTVGSTGGRLDATADDGTRVSLIVPAGALSSGVEITITPAAFRGGPSVVQDYIGGALLEPSGLRFATPARLLVEPPGGLAGAGLLLGVLFDDRGAPEWAIPTPSDDGRALSFPVPHFSAGAVASLPPKEWLEVLQEATGQGPRIVEYGPQQVIFGADEPPVTLVGEFCSRVLLLENGQLVPVANASVLFRIDAESPGSISRDPVTTNGTGYACQQVALPVDLLESSGTLISGSAELLLPTLLTIDTPVRLVASQDRAPFAVSVLPPDPATPDNDSNVFVCADVFSAANSSLPGRGVTVVFGLQGSPSAGTDNDGRGCVTERLRLPDPDGDTEDVLAFTLTAGVPKYTATLGEPGQLRIETVTGSRTFNVTRVPLRAQVSVAAEIRRGTSEQVCVNLSRRVPASGESVTLDIVGPGFWALSANKQVTGTTDALGNFCRTYDAPASLDEGERVEFVLRYELIGPPARSRELTAVARIANANYTLVLTASPTSIATPSGTSQVCAELRLAETGAAVAGETVAFALTGAGALAATTPGVTTNAEGRACTTYTAPDELPENPTDVTVRGDVALTDGRADGSTTIRIGEDGYRLQVAATPSSLSEAGSTSQVCGTLRRAGSDAAVSGESVAFTLTGAGSLSAASAQTGADGAACVTYTAPSQFPTSATDVTVAGEATLTDGSASGSATIRLGPGAFTLSMTGPAGVLNGPNFTTSEGVLCAILQQGTSPVAGVSVGFALSGVGSLSATSATTNAEGRACIRYTTPDPLPDGETSTQTVTGTAQTSAGQVSGSVGIRVAGRLVIVTEQLRSPLLGVAFVDTILAGGGMSRAWSIIDGALPLGLGGVADPPTTGARYIISGTPTELGQSAFVVRVTSGNTSTANSQQAEASFLMQVRDTTSILIGGGGGGGASCGVSLRLSSGSDISPPFIVTATVSAACPGGTQVQWRGFVRGYTSTSPDGFFSDPNFSLLPSSPFDPVQTGVRFAQSATVSYDRDLFLLWKARGWQPEGRVFACLADAAGNPILAGAPADQICARYSWFN